MKQKIRQYRKHFVEEILNGKKLKYPIKKWALNHQTSFNHKFTNSTTDYPITSEIVAVMIKDFGYTKTEQYGEVILRKTK
jgi:hypothetical protein